MIRRLRKLNNHVDKEVHEDVEKDILDTKRTLKRSSSDSYLLAKQIIMDLPLTPSNGLFIKICKYIDDGKYSDLGNSQENWDKWLERTSALLRENKVLLAKKDRR